METLTVIYKTALNAVKDLFHVNRQSLITNKKYSAYQHFQRKLCYKRRPGNLLNMTAPCGTKNFYHSTRAKIRK